MPRESSAQILSQPTPAPLVTAASADWQSNGDPVFFDGNFYFPAGPTTFFDGNVMARTGEYDGVPLYQDQTLEPYSVVYVPIGGDVMRPYERRREGELAGTTGSRMPSFPVQDAAEVPEGQGLTDIQTPPIHVDESSVIPEARGAAESGRVIVDVPSTSASTQHSSARPMRMDSVPPPKNNQGIWIDYHGTKWFSAGEAEAFSAKRFTPIGSYHGLPVYRQVGDRANRIWVSMVPDGPIAPYSTR